MALIVMLFYLVLTIEFNAKQLSQSVTGVICASQKPLQTYLDHNLATKGDQKKSYISALAHWCVDLAAVHIMYRSLLKNQHSKHRSYTFA